MTRKTLRDQGTLSKEAREARKPLPPEVLASALQDRLPDATDKVLEGRPAKTLKVPLEKE